MSRAKAPKEQEAPEFALAEAPASAKKRKVAAKEMKTTPIPEGDDLAAYEHKGVSRVNNPQVGLVHPENDPESGKTKWAYDPHLSPSLQWAGKAERTSFEVDTVSLHVHEQMDPVTILDACRKDSAHDNLFSSAFRQTREASLRESVEFYKHARGWSNRLVAGDSLLVMNSLLKKESMAGQVQMVYMDPPYGIKYGSNFQPFVKKEKGNARDVKDGKDEDLTQEPEMIKAFRDTWELGIHSYLTYLRDRLLLAKELLTEEGSIFMQISDENAHLVRNLMDEVFGVENWCGDIRVVKTSGQTDDLLATVSDNLLWYGKNKTKTKFSRLYDSKGVGFEETGQYYYAEFEAGDRRRLKDFEISNPKQLSADAKPFSVSDISSNKPYSLGLLPFELQGKDFNPPSGRYWTHSPEGRERLKKANRILAMGNSVRFVRYLHDFPLVSQTAQWLDTGVSGFSEEKVYVVQTNTKVIERCLLMTTSPGDLTLDITCGSGTTAFVAEKWGRRWITCDSSRVAITLAKQRLLTASFDYYQLKYAEEGVKGGFNYETVPHVTLKSIANNPEIDEIHAQMNPAVVKALAELNAVLQGKNPDRKGGDDFISRQEEDVRGHGLEASSSRPLPYGRGSLASTPTRCWLITFRTYGTWLPGDEREFVNEDHNTPNTPFLPPSSALHQHAESLLKHAPVALSHAQRQAVRDAIKEVCAHRGWRLMACNVRSNHVHVAVWAKDADKAMNDFKSYATRRMKEAGVPSEGEKTWALHGSTRHLHTPNSREAAVGYVLRRQGDDEVALASWKDAKAETLFHDPEEKKNPDHKGGDGFISREEGGVCQEDVRGHGLESHPLPHGASSNPLPHGRGSLVFTPSEGYRKGQKLNLAKDSLEPWEVPFDFPSDWPESARAPFSAFHAARQAMQKKMDASIAAHADQEVLYDKPQVDKKRRRITGPFTVEAVPAPSVTSLDEFAAPAEATTAIARSGESSRQQQWRDELRKTGIRGKGGQKISFIEVETLSGTKYLHAMGLTPEGERVAISFGPEHAALEQKQVERAFHEAETVRPKPKMVLFCAFSFDPEAAKDIDETKGMGMDFLKVQMNTDLLTEDLKKARSSNESFWLMGQPEISIRKIDKGDDKGKYEVEVHGFDYFDIQRGEHVSGGKGKIALWLLDTDYDNRSLYPRQVFFPMADDKGGWSRLAKTLKAQLDEDAISQYHGTVSLPFAPGPNGKIAVKVVDDRGIESLKILEVE